MYYVTFVVSLNAKHRFGEIDVTVCYIFYFHSNFTYGFDLVPVQNLRNMRWLPSVVEYLTRI